MNMIQPASCVAWFHCFSGISGDMSLGALIDAGADIDEITTLCERLPVAGWRLEVSQTQRAGMAATKADVICDESAADPVVRTLRHITGILEEARLPERVRARAQAIFELLAQAEGRIHSIDPAEVHFHEVGAVDAIIDIVGSVSALEILDISAVQSSPIAQGMGMIKGAHGIMPNPAPATVELLAGVPTYGLDIDAEMTTPTGAAIIATLATSYGSLPAMTVEASGFGAGTRELENRPNLTQVVIGKLARTLDAGQPTILLETNVDDATGETLAHAVSALLEAGANDAWLTPIIMKKGRPAFKVSALADVSVSRTIRKVLVEETGTLGVRAQQLERWPQPRHEDVVELDGGPVRIKVTNQRVKAELEDATKVARASGRPLREVISLVEASWQLSVLGADDGASGNSNNTNTNSTEANESNFNHNGDGR